MASATPAWEPQPAPPTASPAALEFAVLEACLASRSARQLPLHEMESQQQSKGREVQRLLLQAHLEQRSTGEGQHRRGGAALHVRNEFGEMWYTRRRLSTRSLKT